LIDSSFGRFVQQYTLANGSNAKLAFLSQIVFMIMICRILRSTLRRKHYDFMTMWLHLALIGGMLYLLVFEGGRSRYLVQFLPVFVILCGIGYSQIFAAKSHMENTITE
jgi:hypothetical protein